MSIFLSMHALWFLVLVSLPFTWLNTIGISTLLSIFSFVSVETLNALMMYPFFNYSSAKYIMPSLMVYVLFQKDVELIYYVVKLYSLYFNIFGCNSSYSFSLSLAQRRITFLVCLRNHWLWSLQEPVMIISIGPWSVVFIIPVNIFGAWIFN